MKIVASASLNCREAGKALSHPRNNSAVPALLHLALTHHQYVPVETAAIALSAIGTTEAKRALGEFVKHPSRGLEIVYFDSTQLKYTSALGQIPNDNEIKAATSALKSENVFLFDSLERVYSVLDHCLFEP